MDEFTKEELQEIKRCLKHMIQGGITPYSCLTIDIKKKVQSMIDNYCEHAWRKCFADFEYDECTKCGECEL